MPTDYTLRSNWYALYLAIKHKKSADKALSDMGLTRYHPLKTQRMNLSPETIEAVKKLASEGISYNNIGFKLKLPYDTIRFILGKEVKKKMPQHVIQTFIISGILIHQDDTYETIGPIEIKAISLNAAVWQIEKDRNGMLRDIKYKIKQEPA